jgi:hypothetical protein
MCRIKTVRLVREPHAEVAIHAICIGGLTIARSVVDETIALRVMEACRRFVLERLPSKKASPPAKRVTQNTNFQFPRTWKTVSVSLSRFLPTTSPLQYFSFHGGDDRSRLFRLPGAICRLEVDRPLDCNIHASRKIGATVERQGGFSDGALHVAVLWHSEWMAKRKLDADNPR